MSKSFGNMQPEIPHLIQGSGGLSGEIKDVRRDIDAAFGTMEDVGPAGTGPLCLQQLVNPLAASAVGLEAATAPTLTGRTVTAFLAPGLAELLARPRNVTFTTAGTSEASAPATATVTGTDYNDAVLTEVVSIGVTAGLYESVKAFKTVVSIVFSASRGAIGDLTISIGYGNKFGLAAKIRTELTVPVVLAEYAVNAKVTNGVFASAANSAPNGTYTPNTAPNGTNDYSILFLKDMS